MRWKCIFCLIHFRSILPFYTPWQHQMLKGLLVFSGGIENANSGQKWFNIGKPRAKVNNGNAKTMCEICSKLTAKTPEDFIDFILVSFLLTQTIFHCFSVSNCLTVSWDTSFRQFHCAACQIFAILFAVLVKLISVYKKSLYL